jgi:hypothetical protein
MVKKWLSEIPSDPIETNRIQPTRRMWLISGTSFGIGSLPRPAAEDVSWPRKLQLDHVGSRFQMILDDLLTYSYGTALLMGKSSH